MVAFQYVSILIVILCVSIRENRANAGASVTLTVEGGVSLVGEHCPGTLRLFCEGVDLTILRWSYNSTNKDITFFHPDDQAETITSMLAPFIESVELSKVTQSPQRNLGKFSSILTLNISQLEKQHITEITCGDPETSHNIPINVRLRQQLLPETPRLMNTAYEYPELTVSWEVPVVSCSSYSELIHYDITLTSNNVSSQVLTTSGGVCTTVCSATLSLSGPGNYQLELQATNEKGTSNSATQNIFIGSGFSEGVSVGATVASVLVVLVLSTTLGFFVGVGVHHIIVKRKAKSVTDGGSVPRRQTQNSRDANRRDVVYSNQTRTQQENRNSTHSYCEIDDPNRITYSQPTGVTKKPIQVTPNESYGQSHVRSSKVVALSSEVTLKTNVSYNKVEEAKKRGASCLKEMRDKGKMKANQSSATARENTDKITVEQYDYVDKETFRK